ncbi:MAG TPA: MBL fold metallo-hydrolase [Actinomycetota bacterium]|nr:MBL fold metallo-hydrolase [Actinomycetota bacterium]
MATVTGLGHAGLKIEASGERFLIDPWLSPRGAFQGSWFPYPDNSHLLGADLFAPSAVILSHEHLDHVDPWFLARVPPSVPAVVPRYPSPVLRRKILAAGERQVIEIPPWEWAEVGAARVLFVSEESPMNHDSAIVVQAGGRTVLDLNDARLSPVQFREIRARVGGPIDVFAFQAAGASWYPMCYEYPEERRRELSSRKRLAKLTYAARAMEIVEPIVGLPFAGPPCFLDPDLFAMNDEMDGGIFPDQAQAAEFLQARALDNVALLLPGDTWDAADGLRHPDPTWGDFSFADRAPYLRDYARRRRAEIDAVIARTPEPSGSLWEPFREYFGWLVGVSPYFNRKIGMRVGFDITGPGGGRWAVDFRPGSEGVDPEMGSCPHVYRFASRWLPPILRGEVPWEDFFLSLRFSARRAPDVYNDHLLGLLKFAEPDALRRVEEYETSLESEEWLTLHAEGRSYRVARYCPHAGNDLLETGEILPGRILRCLAHHYEFSLDSGECLTSSGLELDVEPVDPVAADRGPD